MHSKPLRQSLRLTLDAMSMRGPLKLRDVGEEFMRNSPDEYWSLADLHEAKMNYGMIAAKGIMTERLSEEDIDRYLSVIPDDLRPMLQKMTRMTCITAGGGKGAEWVLTFLATPDQLDDNYRLKRHIADATLASCDDTADLRDFLIANDAVCIMDYLEKRKGK